MPASASPQTTGPFDPQQIRTLSEHKFANRTYASGQLVFSCVPSASDLCAERVESVMESLGQTPTSEQKEALRKKIKAEMTRGFAASPHAKLQFSYAVANPQLGLTGGLKVQINLELAEMADCYEQWVVEKTGPLFGPQPDAKVMDAAATLAARAGSADRVPVLDVGAGTGRNTLPLARQGHPTDALDATASFVAQIRAAAQAESLPVRAFRGNVLAEETKLPPNAYELAIASEVVSHFRSAADLRLFLARLSEAVRPGGMVLFNSFLAVDGYEPGPLERELSEVVWSLILTRAELRGAIAGLPYTLLSDESVLAYERDRHPAESWPPTDWYEAWADGRNLFPTDKMTPMELRWIALQRH